MKGTINAWLIIFLASLLFLPAAWLGPSPVSLGDPQREMGPVKTAKPPDVTLNDTQVALMSRIKDRHADAIMKAPGVYAFGLGMKGRQPAFIMLVDRTAPKTSVPIQIEGYPVEVKFGGQLSLHDGGTGCSPCHSNQEPLPTVMGQSTSTDQACGSCTLGFVACRGSVRGHVTNRHCNFNSAGCHSASIFNHFERSTGDNGCAVASLIGTTNFVAPMGPNTDAAFIQSTVSQTQCTIKDIGIPSTTPGTAMVNECMRKSGRTTGLTFGRVVGVNVTANINVGANCGGVIQFTNEVWYQDDTQCGVGPTSRPGDSGSPVLKTSSFEIIALNHAGDGGINGFGPTIQATLAALGANLDLPNCGGCLGNISCPTSAAVAGTAAEQSTLDTFYAFRDQVLKNSPQGQQYIKLYNDNAAEATTMLLKNYRVLLQARDLILRFTPVARDMIAGKPVIVLQKDSNDVDQFLNTISGLRPSSKLQGAIDQVRRDLRNTGIQAQFNVSIH